MKKDCWELEENVSKHPNNWKRNKTGAAAAGGGSGTDGAVKFLLALMKFPDSQSLLKNMNIWISDTGASVHVTPHNLGMSNKRAVTQADAITVAN